MAKDLLAETSSPPILSRDLLGHYVNHGIDDIETFLRSSYHDNASRFIRLNPRFDAFDTLNLLKVWLWCISLE